MNGTENKEPVNFGDPATEPVDLAQAFKMLNRSNREAANANVANDEPDGDEGNAVGSGASSVGSGEESSPEPGEENGAQSSGEPGDDSDLGGSATVIEPIDFNARKQEILTGIQQDAINAVRKEFNDNGIKPVSIEDLYSRDEQSGRVTFKNPDDPTRDFASRAEAQQWCDAFNKQINMRFRQDVNKKQQELVAQSAPVIRLIEFAPKFEALDQVTKDILDDLIEPYSIYDNRGDVIGFNVNLDSALAQAQKIAKRFNKAPEPQSSEDSKEAKGDGKQASRPAVNLPTGSGQSKDETEPKSLGEAIKMYDKMNREKGKK